MYRIVTTKSFQKELKKLHKGKRYDIQVIHEVIEKLQRKELLPKKYKDHRLKGRLRDYRECHVYPDYLLIYRYHDDVLILELVNLGSHSQLFT